MGFFNSLSEIYKNNGNFNKWEQNQRDKKAQRQELYRQAPPSQQDLEQAKRTGKTIIDVIDVMDNHSENVAENVETATAPLVAITPYAAFLASGFGVTKFIIQPNSKKIANIKNSIIKDPKLIDLYKEIKEHINNNDTKYQNLSKIEQKYKMTPAERKGWYSVKSLLNKNQIEKITDPDLRSKAMNVYKDYMKSTAKFRRPIKIGAWSVLGTLIASFIGINIYTTKLQVDSSKIARYQARESLKDPKAFVAYTPEQIAKAQEYIKQHPELEKQKKKEKLKSGMFKSIINVIKDRKEYKKAKLKDKDDSRKIDRQLTSKELHRAKQDQEVIQRTVRIINNEAEKNSENMETAADIIMGSSPFLGMAAGFVVNAITNWTGLTDRLVKHIVKKEGSQEAQTAYAEFSKMKKGAPGYTKKFLDFSSKMLDFKNIKDNNKDTEAKGIEILKTVKKYVATGLAHYKGRSWLVAGLSGIVAGIGGALLALKLQKSAARAGRYTAKRELEKDPKNFIGYTDEEHEKVKNIKSEKPTFAQKVKDYAMFIPNVIKQYHAYNHYKKHEFKKNQILNDQLQKLDVTDKQLKDAKNLQRKLFNTFEKVDDNSQQYSESMEAAIDIAQPFVLTGGYVAMVTPFIYLSLQVIKGKKSPAQLVNKLTGYLSKSSKIIESRYFKKYLESIGKNIEHKVGNVSVDKKTLGKLLKDVDVKEDYIPTILSKIKANFHNITGELRNKTNEEQIATLSEIKNSLTAYFKKLETLIPQTKQAKVKTNVESSVLKTNIENLFDRLIFDTRFEKNPQARLDFIDIMTGNTKYIKEKMTDEQFNAAIEKLIDIPINGNVKFNLNDLLKPIFDKSPELYTPEIAQFMEQFDKKVTPDEFKSIISKIINRNSYLSVAETGKNITHYITNLPGINFNYRITEIPTAVRDFSNNIGKLQNFTGSQIVKQDIIDRINKIKSPKDFLTEFKKSVEQMSESDFSQKMETIGFSSMDKKTCLEILPKLEKIMERIPEKELKSILDAFMTEFNKHPDEIIKLIQKGKIKEILNTPYLRNVITTLSIAHTTATIAITAIISFALADLQLKAGRLGVMKAIDSLKDPAYYANIEADNDLKTNQTSSTTKSTNTMSTSNNTAKALLEGLKQKN